MSVITQLGNYVKFLRGTPNAYSQLTPKDNDTLYFVSEKDADRGVLYLGEKLISGSLSSSTTLADLTDVLIGAGIEAGSLLYYDGTQWTNKSLAEIFEIIIGVMTGASSTKDGRSGLVPTPVAGQQNLFLRGDATWANPTEAVQRQVDIISAQVGTLINNDTDKSVRTIAAEEVAKVVNGAPEALDTLKEIADYIAEHPGATDLAERLAALENTINTSGTGLKDRVTILENGVGDLRTLISRLQDKDVEHDQAITDIQTFLANLRWQHMEIV